MMKALYGFGKPYDFHKILPFLAGVFLLLTILALSLIHISEPTRPY